MTKKEMIEYLEKVLFSCKTADQVDSWSKWASKLQHDKKLFSKYTWEISQRDYYIIQWCDYIKRF